VDQLLRDGEIPAHFKPCCRRVPPNSSTYYRGLKFLFASTLSKLGLDISDKLMTPSKAPFYGIVPGNSSTPIGTVTLPVTFGTPDNYQTKLIKFVVANFESSYDAILGRPALAKFMAIPHYVYLLLKMPDKTGVLTLRGDLLKSYEYDREAIDYASNIRIPSTASKVLTAAKELSLSKDLIPTKKSSQSSVKPVSDISTKTIQLHERDSSKTAIIGIGLGDK